MIDTRDCARCDGYEFVTDPATGELVDCPDCRALLPAVLQMCPVHGRRAVNGRCRSCAREAEIGAEILLERARFAAKTAATADAPEAAVAC